MLFAAVAEKQYDHSEQVCQRGRNSHHISHGGGNEHFPCPALLSSIQQSRLTDYLQRSAASVQFHRKRSKLKQRHKGIEGKAGQNKGGSGVVRNKHTHQGQRDAEPGTKVADRNNGVSDFYWNITRGVLCGMPRLMAGNTDGRNGGMPVSISERLICLFLGL